MISYKNKYITTSISLLLIILLVFLRNNITNKIINNIFLKLLCLILIYITIEKDFRIGLFLMIIYIILDQLSTQYYIDNKSKELEHSKQLEHYTQDYIIDNNIN